MCSSTCTPCTSTPSPSPSATPLSSQPVPSARVELYGTLNAGYVGGDGVVVYNVDTGVISVSQPTCGDTTLPDSYRDASTCDNSKGYNYCVRGIVPISAQQSQAWCQSDSGVACPANLPPVLLFGEAASPDYKLVGSVTNSRGDVNRFVSPSNQCYGPANAITTINQNGQFYQMSAVGLDLCVGIKCDGSAGFLGLGVQNCNVHLSLLFSCYNPCNACVADQTASCAVIPDSSDSARLPTAKCTCQPGWAGATCSECQAD